MVFTDQTLGQLFHVTKDIIKGLVGGQKERVTVMEIGMDRL